MKLFQKIAVNFLVVASTLAIVPTQAMTTSNNNRNTSWYVKAAVAGTLVIGGGVYAYKKYSTHKAHTTFTPAELEKYKIPADLKSILDQNVGDIRRYEDTRDCPVVFPKWMRGYALKFRTVEGRVKRIRGHQHCEQIIQRNKSQLSLLEVSEKYIYHYDTNKVCVVAKMVEGGTMNNEDTSRLITREQMKQLADFIMLTGWKDALRRNIALRDNGNICIIDTDSFSLSGGNPFYAGLFGLQRFCEQSIKSCDAEAQQYLHWRIDQELQKNNAQSYWSRFLAKLGYI